MGKAQNILTAPRSSSAKLLFRFTSTSEMFSSDLNEIGL